MTLREVASHFSVVLARDLSEEGPSLNTGSPPCRSDDTSGAAESSLDRHLLWSEIITHTVMPPVPYTKSCYSQALLTAHMYNI